MSNTTASAHDHTRSASVLPPTVNLHLVAHCNMSCRYCYAPFEEERRVPALPVEAVYEILAELAGAGVRRVTFAGGEPTLIPELGAMLRRASDLGLVTAIVTNAALITRRWLDAHGPYLRWLTLSIDSVVPASVVALGRQTKRRGRDHLAQVLEVAALVHEFNRTRPDDRRIRLKMNITVTATNVSEDPTLFVRACAPEKVKILQMLLVEGENDAAADLVCADDAFASYAARARTLERGGIEVVVESAQAMDGSYAMVDPTGRFYQRVDGRYAHSRPILEAGAMAAWADVGGFDQTRFKERGGDYEPGGPARGNVPYWIAIDGLDGTGKSTVVHALARELGADVITNPPQSLSGDRSKADAARASERRAWYRAANDDAAHAARVACAAGRPVIMDRSLASTLAFAAAEEGRIASPEEWPMSAPKPDLLVVLSIDEDVRRRRLDARGSEPSVEEQRLADDAAFRGRVLAGYAALGWMIQAGGPVAEVVRAIMALVRAGVRNRP